MELCKADEQSNFAKFFAALKCAVCLMDKIKGLGSFVVQPIKGIKLKEHLNDRYRVYKNNDLV